MSFPSNFNPSQPNPAQTIQSPTHQSLTLQIDFAWSKFRNQISEKNGDHLTPLYIQHFRPTHPQLRFESATDSSPIASGTIHSVSISADCKIRGHKIELKPLKRWKTHYNYLSKALSSGSGRVAITWITDSTHKTWNFICLDANQLPIAKFAVNIWALKQVGNFYFEKSKEDISEEVRDEVVFIGLTLFYLMAVRMNSPLHLLGAAFAKPGKVEGPDETTEHAYEMGKVKNV
ncbi:uncharacterized protein K460DRAFT_361295 [Cucurbitaria berberidis CBS 394.84]|uniref:Uncharacterized protein n=1 Tax=Cucurbitaria berberidis CBS 394.84 TaxID=1168544 RepID=A0A9P4LDW5_9PLEO|nr:uncharacterized protein K460DRAFT_361295 [Cucurbitaria berberidis CBS 394.84]KAF1850519.1 hypothetical protein K460DRAFT_361295 [Cucurbitaria berberidis CBS 394.84]